MEYIVCFYEDLQIDDQPYKKGDIIRVNQTEMFKWVEKVHLSKIKISIYTCTMVCDLS